MKSASAATLGILSTGNFLKAELYRIDLADGSSVFLTSADAPITVGAQLYSDTIAIKRGSITQKIGLEVQSLDLTLCPRSVDVTPPTFSGFQLAQAAKLGFLDDARITFSKIFLSSWDDTSPGLVKWSVYRVADVHAGRFIVELQLNDDIETLSTPMPKNIITSGCIHTVFDAGCQLVASTFQVSGAASGSPTQTLIPSNLTQANGYWDLGRLTFTSGANTGLKRVVKSYVNASGAITLIKPLPVAPSAGDTFTILPSCKKTQAACANTSVANGPAFNNIAHFRGAPFVPVPETLYDGGVSKSNTEAPAGGSQSGPVIGSLISGNQKIGSGYVA